MPAKIGKMGRMAAPRRLAFSAKTTFDTRPWGNLDSCWFKVSPTADAEAAARERKVELSV